MNEVAVRALQDFGRDLGFDNLLPEGTDAAHWQCENDDLMGFIGLEGEILCYLQRSYEPFVLNSLWEALFSLVDQEEWRDRQWHIGLTKEGQLVVFSFLSQEGLGSEILHKTFNEIWQLREVLSQL